MRNKPYRINNLALIRLGHLGNGILHMAYKSALTCVYLLQGKLSGLYINSSSVLCIVAALDKTALAERVNHLGHGLPADVHNGGELRHGHYFVILEITQ